MSSEFPIQKATKEHMPHVLPIHEKAFSDIVGIQGCRDMVRHAIEHEVAYVATRAEEVLAYGVVEPLQSVSDDTLSAHSFVIIHMMMRIVRGDDDARLLLKNRLLRMFKRPEIDFSFLPNVKAKKVRKLMQKIEQDKACYACGFVTRQQSRRLGLGTRILERGTEEVIESGRTDMLVCCNNVPSTTMFAKQGFETLAEFSPATMLGAAGALMHRSLTKKR